RPTVAGRGILLKRFDISHCSPNLYPVIECFVAADLHTVSVKSTVGNHTLLIGGIDSEYIIVIHISRGDIHPILEYFARLKKLLKMVRESPVGNGFPLGVDDRFKTWCTKARPPRSRCGWQVIVLGSLAVFVLQGSIIDRLLKIQRGSKCHLGFILKIPSGFCRDNNGTGRGP